MLLVRPPLVVVVGVVTADARKAQQQLGLSAAVPLFEAIRRTGAAVQGAYGY